VWLSDIWCKRLSSAFRGLVCRIAGTLHFFGFLTWLKRITPTFLLFWIYVVKRLNSHELILDLPGRRVITWVLPFGLFEQGGWRAERAAGGLSGG
jgi:hypothetical protein